MGCYVFGRYGRFGGYSNDVTIAGDLKKRVDG
jgi:hypothetical protein